MRHTIIKNFLKDDECDYLINYFKKDSSTKKMAYARDDSLVYDTQLLKMEYSNTVAWNRKIVKGEFSLFNNTNLINKKIWGVIIHYSKQNNFNITEQRGIFIQKYTKNGHFTWHTDGYGWTYKPPHGLPGVKEIDYDKLSISIQLSNPDEYEGGELQFGQDSKGNTKRDPTKEHDNYELLQKSITSVFTAPKNRGSLALHNGFSYHRVTPITKGVRYSLVNFYQGPKNATN